MTAKYANTLILDYDNYDGFIVGKYVPKGYRVIEVHGDAGCYVCWIENDEVTADFDDECCEMMKEMAEGCYHNTSRSEWLSQLFDGHPEARGRIDPESDIILYWDVNLQNVEAYVPPSIKEIIWTDLSYSESTVDETVKKVEAAHFLTKYLDNKRRIK